MDVIVDIDGTLADCQHRIHWIKSKPKNHDAFFAVVSLDTPIKPVIDLVRVLLMGEANIVFCSGRPERTRKDTLAWLVANGLYAMDKELFMRKDGDFRDDSIIKLELLADIRAAGYNPTIAIDDRDRVVAAWRAAGLTCLQVAPGDF